MDQVLSLPEFIEFLDYPNIAAISCISPYLRNTISSDEIIKVICKSKLQEYLKKLSMYQVLDLLEYFAKNNLSDFFIELVSNYYLFSCPHHCGGRYGEIDFQREINEYALYLSLKHGIKCSCINLCDYNANNIKVYWAGFNNLTEHPFVQKMREEVLQNLYCEIYAYYFRGLREGKHINSIKEEILRPSARFWYASTLHCDDIFSYMLDYDRVSLNEVDEAKSRFVGKTDLPPLHAAENIIGCLWRKKICLDEKITFRKNKIKTKSDLKYYLNDYIEPTIFFPMFERKSFKKELVDLFESETCECQE